MQSPFCVWEDTRRLCVPVGIALGAAGSGRIIIDYEESSGAGRGAAALASGCAPGEGMRCMWPILQIGHRCSSVRITVGTTGKGGRSLRQCCTIALRLQLDRKPNQPPAIVAAYGMPSARVEDGVRRARSHFPRRFVGCLPPIRLRNLDFPFRPELGNHVLPALPWTLLSQ